MKDTHSKSEVLSWDCGPDAAPNCQPQQSGWDDHTKQQPLSNLFHYNIIMSPTHEEEYEEGKAPAVGELVDFDDDDDDDDNEPIIEARVIRTMGGDDDDDEVEYSGNLSCYGHEEAINPEASTVQQSDEDVVSIDESVLEIAMFEAVLENTGEEEHEEEKLHGEHNDEEELFPLPVVITVTVPVPSKRSTQEMKEARPVKKAKKEESMNLKQAPLAAVKPTPVFCVDDFDTAEDPGKIPAVPRRRRPNCLFVNHFGTRLNEKGEAVKVNSAVKTPAPARISSEESVSIRTKSTGRSSKSTSTAKTPLSFAMSLTPSTSKIPSVVSIVTPAVKKPIKSSCLDDITMEEDEMEPLHHGHPMEHGEESMCTGHLPYVNSLTNQPTSPPTPGMPTARMMPGMMPGGIPPLNFNRPFPLLQRRAFLNSCHHPMSGHPAAAFGAHGWHAFPRPGMPYSPHPFAGPPPSSAAASSSQAQWKKP